MATLFIYYLEGEKCVDWKEKLAKKDVPEKIKEQTVKKIVSYVTWFPTYFLICTFLVVLTTLRAFLLNWTRWTLILFLIALGCQMFLYIMFKIASNGERFLNMGKKGRKGTLDETYNPPLP